MSCKPPGQISAFTASTLICPCRNSEGWYEENLLRAVSKENTRGEKKLAETKETRTKSEQAQCFEADPPLSNTRAVREEGIAGPKYHSHAGSLLLLQNHCRLKELYPVMIVLSFGKGTSDHPELSRLAAPASRLSFSLALLSRGVCG